MPGYRDTHQWDRHDDNDEQKFVMEEAGQAGGMDESILMAVSGPAAIEEQRDSDLWDSTHHRSPADAVDDCGWIGRRFRLD